MIFRFPGKKLQDKSDAELIAEFIATGDLEVLGKLYSRYMHLIYGVCLKYLKNRDESKDAVMQIFEKLIVEIHRHRIENFKSWLHVVTKNYCLMEIRSRKSLEEKHSEWVNDSFVFMENETFLHPIDDEKGYTEIALNDCIEKLKAEQRECIKEFYFENRCYNEIASRMGLDERKVKSYLQNGKRNLKLCLEQKK